MRKIINFVPTGTQPTKENSLAPLEVSEIVEEVHQAYELGITIVHLHAREPQTHINTYRKDIFGQIISGIRKHAKDLLICTSLTGRNCPELEKRIEVLQLKPDMGSLTMGSVDFPLSTTVNRPETILSLIDKMDEYGVMPEIECFDDGMLNYTNYLIEKGKLKPPYYLNLIFGNRHNAQSDIQTIAAIKSKLPANSIVCYGGIGRQQLKSNVYGLIEADGVRVGLEDNLYYRNQQKATNIELLARVHRIMNELDLQIMKAEELRQMGYGNRYFNNR